MVSAIGYYPYIYNRSLISSTTKTQQSGLTSTTESTEDTSSVQSSQSSQATDTENSVQDTDKTSTLTSAQQGSQPQPPWYGLMQQLGLSLTGSKESDFAAISAAISSMQSQSKNDTDKAKIASFQSQFQSYGGQANSTPFTTEQTQNASLNKHFLLNNKSSINN